MKMMNRNANRIEVVDVLEEFGLRNGAEYTQLECKEAVNKLPRAFWETYSSFANTSGGIVILGVKENREAGSFEVTGVSNPFEMVKNLHDTLSNRLKVNIDILTDDSVEIVEDVSGKKVILVYVPEASVKQRPVYLNQNQQNTYLRKGESDIRASEDELNAMIRNSATSTFDANVMKGYGLDDLDKSTLSEFKGKVSAVFPEKAMTTWASKSFSFRQGFTAAPVQVSRIIRQLVVFCFSENTTQSRKSCHPIFSTISTTRARRNDGPIVCPRISPTAGR